MKKILLTIIMIIIMTGCKIKGNPEAICLKDGSSETVVSNMVLHDGRFYPIQDSRRGGCLILYESGMNGLIANAAFVHPGDSDFDHCCIDGE